MFYRVEIIEKKSIKSNNVFTYLIFSFHIDAYDIFPAINVCEKKTFTYSFLLLN